MGRWLALLLAVLMLPSLSAQAQEARLSVSVDSVFVGARFALSVAVTHPAGTSVLFPEVPEGDAEAAPLLAFGDAEVLSARRLPPEARGAARVDSIVYEAATFALDEATVGPVTVRLAVGGDTTMLASNTVALPVRSVLPSPDADLLPPGEPLPFPSPWPLWLAVAVATLLAVALAAWLWRLLRRPGPERIPRPAPYPEALQRLGALIPPETEAMSKPFYVALADLMRTYLARTLGLPALELTTRELVGALRADARLPANAVSAVRGTLRLCDLVKFADLRPDVDAHTAALAKAREAIEQVEAAVRPPEPERDEQQTEEQVLTPQP